MLDWMWANPWSLLLALATLVALALWARRLFHPDYFYERGLRRCNVCPGSSKSRHKIVYDNRTMAEAAARHYQPRYGKQRPYLAPCGYWHLTSQNPSIRRRRTVKR